MEKNDTLVYIGFVAVAAVSVYHGELAAGSILLGLTGLLYYDRECRNPTDISENEGESE